MSTLNFKRVGNNLKKISMTLKKWNIVSVLSSKPYIKHNSRIKAVTQHKVYSVICVEGRKGITIYISQDNPVLFPDKNHFS